MANIYEIAKLAKVSIGTVDRVVHHRGRVSKETEFKVKRVLRELNYRPSVYARGLALSRTFCFGVLMPKTVQDDGYWQLPEIGIKRASEELKVYGIRIKYFFYDKYSHGSFRKTCHSVLHSNPQVDGLLIAPVLSKDAESFLQQLPQSVPFVFFDSYIPNARCLSFIGQNSFQSGVLSAKLMRMMLCGNGPVSVMRILPEDYHIEDRVNGFRAFFETHCQNSLKVYNADRIQHKNIFQSLTKTIQDDNPDLEGIFVPHACVGQVAKYLQKDPPKQRIHLIGYDLTLQNRKFLKDGIMDFVISQRPEMQGYRGAYSLYRHVVLKDKIEKNTVMPIDIVTKENVEYYQNGP